MSPGLDTNVLVRWLVDDDPAQSRQVQRLFESLHRSRSTAFVPCTVALELEWVLRSRYGFDRDTILKTFTSLLETRELDFQFEAAIEHALHAYRTTPADFADCLHAGLCVEALRTPMLTLDVKATRIAQVALVQS